MMLRRFYKKFLPTATTPHFVVLQFLKPYTLSTVDSDKPSSPTVSFLRSSCGLSADAARSLARRFHLETFDKAFSVLALLKDYGFNEAQVAGLVSRTPSVLKAHTDKTLKPKLEFYREIGLTGADLPKILAASPWPLMCSLTDRLRPNAKLLRSILGSKESVAAALRHSPLLIREDLRKDVLPKIEALRAYGVPDAVLVRLLTIFGNTFVPRLSRFDEAFDAIKKMGICPTKSVFAHALGVFAQIPKSHWEAKVENLRNLGWSQDQILAAFARHPNIASSSEEKIRRNIKFLEEKLGWGAEYVSLNPVVLSLSLEKRMIPRYTVLRILMGQGLLKAGFVASQFTMTDRLFLGKFVMRYREKAPEIVSVIKD